MSVYAVNPQALLEVVAQVVGDKARHLAVARGELSLVVDAADLLAVAARLAGLERVKDRDRA